MESRRLVVLVLAACALALPFFLWGFRTYQLAFAGTHAIAILGLNLITGQAGLISLGHGAFYGLGAYTVAVLMRHGGVSAYAGILAAALVCLAAGYLFGRMVARLARFYLALATFALALAVPQTLKSSYLSPWTGGVRPRRRCGLYSASSSRVEPAARASVARSSEAGTSTSSAARSVSGRTSPKPNRSGLRPTIAAARIFGT